MTQFKVGDRVRRTEGAWKGMSTGDVAVITEIGNPCPNDLGFEEFGFGHSSSKFELANKFAEGDILSIEAVWSGQDYIKVLEVTKYGYITTKYQNSEKEAREATEADMEILPFSEESDYTLVTDKADVKELTLMEVAEKFGVPVEKVRIKD